MYPSFITCVCQGIIGGKKKKKISSSTCDSVSISPEQTQPAGAIGSRVVTPRGSNFFILLRFQITVRMRTSGKDKIQIFLRATVKMKP